MKNIKLLFVFALVISVLGCQMEPEEEDLYPSTEHGIVYLGMKSGLNSASSNDAFDTGLAEIAQAYVESNPSSSNDFVFDGVTYEFTNLQSISGGVPTNIWDQYWKDISEYSFEIGSCWGFVYGQIPSRGGIGTAYVFYTIITYVSSYSGNKTRYIAYKGDVRPKK
ncbi:MAG: hypothetical protein LBK63_06995 [Treponema sp.]|jgi:hypothetical protein|nr:hypothetical protein [Treponema sp.]